MESGIGRRDIPSRQPGVRRQPANGHIQNQYEDMRQRNQCLRQKLQVSPTYTQTLHTYTNFRKIHSVLARHNKTLGGAKWIPDGLESILGGHAPFFSQYVQRLVSQPLRLNLLIILASKCWFMCGSTTKGDKTNTCTVVFPVLRQLVARYALCVSRSRCGFTVTTWKWR